MLVSLTPGACLWPAAMIVWGPGSSSREHRHHCVQLSLAIDGTLRIKGGSQPEWIECGAALVRADAQHAVDARGVMVLIAFVDPESQLGAALSQGLEADISPVRTRELARWRRAIGAESGLSESRIEAWIRDLLLNGEAPVNIHPRVSRVLRYLRAQPGVLGDVSLPALASIAGLSESRFMHVFTESLGVAVRPYILWLRVQRACGELIAGNSVTKAAMEAGFSDAAHLTRTFRRMLGITPTELAASRKVARGVSLQAESSPSAAHLSLRRSLAAVAATPSRN
jgi:AraC-like DNA-binding protein